MTTFKRIGLSALGLAIALASGCDRHSSKEVYYLVSANMGLPYWQNVANGFNKSAAQLKVTAKVVGPENYDPQGELDALQKAVAAKPAGILISAADVAVLQPGINAAVAAGIPVITVDSDAAGSHRLFFIGTNNIAAGRLGGRRLVERLGGKGNVVFFTIANQLNLEERLKGYKDVFANYPNIKIVDVFDMKGDSGVAMDKAQEDVMRQLNFATKGDYKAVGKKLSSLKRRLRELDEKLEELAEK